MSARPDDLARIQEIYDVATQTKDQLVSLSFSKEQFLNPNSDTEDLIAEGLINRVLRLTEEINLLSKTVANQYGFDSKGASGVRNFLAHAYFNVDKEIIWDVLDNELDNLINSCTSYCDDRGIELEH